MISNGSHDRWPVWIDGIDVGLFEAPLERFESVGDLVVPFATGDRQQPQQADVPVRPVAHLELRPHGYGTDTSRWSHWEPGSHGSPIGSV